MNSLESLASRVANEYKQFDIYTDAVKSEDCKYDPQTDTIYLNFCDLDKNVNKFKLLHELSHRVQKELLILFGDTSEIEVSANKIAHEAYKKLGFEVDFFVRRHINYNNLRQLVPGITEKEALRRASTMKEIQWRV
jgi:Zn-dependent peptidase ImmA (M78 family)